MGYIPESNSVFSFHPFNLPCEGETVRYPNGEEWTLKRDHSSMKLYLEDPHGQRHPSIQDTKDAAQLLADMQEEARALPFK